MVSKSASIRSCLLSDRREVNLNSLLRLDIQEGVVHLEVLARKIKVPPRCPQSPHQFQSLDEPTHSLVPAWPSSHERLFVDCLASPDPNLEATRPRRIHGPDGLRDYRRMISAANRCSHAHSYWNLLGPGRSRGHRGPDEERVLEGVLPR